MKSCKSLLILLASAFCLVGCSGESNEDSSSQPTPSVPQEPSLKEKGKSLVLKRTTDDYPYHLNGGTYQLYLTEQFNQQISSLTEATQYRAIDGIKTGVDEFNQISSNLKFVLNNFDNRHTAHGIQYAEQSTNSVSITMDRHEDGDPVTFDYIVDSNGLISMQAIEFNSKYMFSAHDYYQDFDEMNAPKNSYARTITEYVLLKLIGFDNQKGQKRGQTIMRDDFVSTREYTPDYDVWCITQYNYEFANGLKPSDYVPFPYILYVNNQNNRYVLTDNIENSEERCVLNLSLTQGDKLSVNARVGSIKLNNFDDTSASFVTQYVYEGTTSDTTLNVTQAGTYNIFIHKTSHLVRVRSAI